MRKSSPTNDARQRQRLRRFIGAWAARRAPVAIAEIQAATLTRFGDDVLFIEAFLPIALGEDRAQRRTLLQAPLAAAVLAELHALDTGGQSRCRLNDDQWVKRANSLPSEDG